MLVNMWVYTNDRGPEMRWEMAVWRKIRRLATVPPKEIVNADPIPPNTTPNAPSDYGIRPCALALMLLHSH